MSHFSLTNNEDTIIAIATPPGKGAIGIIRVSGKNAISIVSSVFHGKDLSTVPSHTIHLGTIRDEEKIVDEVLVTVFKSPHSYTSEDVIEISCHGSGFILSQVMQLLLSKGARLAKAGEFTLRAFLNGKLDLAQAEAVADIVASDNENARQVAINQMRGGFSAEIKTMREKLVEYASLLELELDFSEEDVEFASRNKLKDLIGEIKSMVDKLIESFMVGNVIKNGVPTVIAGKPNSGKSTLMNALLNEEKAIVSEEEGTTRDFIEDEIHIDGITYRFIDTAGIREARDKIEQMGIERTRKKMKEASVIIYMFDLKNETMESIGHQVEELDQLGIPYIKTGNKTDKASPALLKILEPRKDFILISALKKNNLEGLKKHLKEILDIGRITIGDTVVTNARHYESLYHARQSLGDIMSGMEKNATGDLLAEDVRQTIYYLGEITGEITNDDLLASIFSKFCIGK